MRSNLQNYRFLRQQRGGLVVHGGATIARLEGNIWAVPVERLLV